MFDVTGDGPSVTLFKCDRRTVPRHIRAPLITDVLSRAGKNRLTSVKARLQYPRIKSHSASRRSALDRKETGRGWDLWRIPADRVPKGQGERQ